MYPLIGLFFCIGLILGRSVRIVVFGLGGDPHWQNVVGPVFRPVVMPVAGMVMALFCCAHLSHGHDARN